MANVRGNFRSRVPAVLAWLLLCGSQFAPSSSPPLELSRPVRSWEFLSAVGTRAGLFGNEAGEFEAWVYPLKILRNLHLQFLVGGRVLPASALARTVSVRPEASSIDYAGDTFRVQETFFVPVREAGAVITFEIETAEPLDIEVQFEPDFQLEWPEALGGTYVDWNAGLKAFFFGEEQKKYAALAGSPSATDHRASFSDNYSASQKSSLRLGVTSKGKDTKLLVIAGSVNGRAEAEATYKRLSSDYESLENEARKYYRSYLDRTVSLELPDAQLQAAYDWSRVSILQGLVANPFLGSGLIAGYRTSGSSQRPGFAWFFGRDALWTTLALNAEGDFATSRTALEFLGKYQRPDGKIEHEISQSASLVPWFTGYPYAYASADATPLFLIAANDYVVRSGDGDFARVAWDKLWLAYQFLRSTYGRDGLPQNAGVGHGWVEGGPLLPVGTELYQSGLGAEAVRALASLAESAGKHDVAQRLASEFTQQRDRVNQAFWVPDKKLFAFALDTGGRQVPTPSVLASVPMWFHVLDDDKAEAMINVLADYDHQTDWGTRIISSSDPRYNPGGYHYGSVWPLFTGWASVGEYRYHRGLPAYSNLRANSLLALDGAVGHVTEVLSGDFYQPISSASPHQIWSAAMVVSPMLRGMLGLEVEAPGQRAQFAPHIPAGWKFLRVNRIAVGNGFLYLAVRRTLNAIELEVRHSGAGECLVSFAPALSLRTRVVSAELDGHTVSVLVQSNTEDQHAQVEFRVGDKPRTVRLRLRNDFAIGLPSTLPALGAPSQGVRVTKESWSENRDALTLEVSGISGRQYELPVWNRDEIATVEGGELVDKPDGEVLRVAFPPGSEGYVRSRVSMHFSSSLAGKKVH